MSHLSKIDLHLTQLVLKTKNLKNDKRNVLIGGLSENISFIKNNPLNININSSENLFYCEASLDSKSEYDIQYINRIQNTPFFVSYLINDKLALKILDFYDWRDNNSIYRLFIIKKLNFNSNSEQLNINLNFDSNLEKISEKQIKISKLLLKISENNQINKNLLTANISVDSDICSFAININFNTQDISSITIDNTVKKFYELKEICKKNHISIHFLTKNQNAEIELDELWNYQKYILPNLFIEESIIKNDNSSEIVKYWVDDFCKYFELAKEVNFNINQQKDKLSGLLEDLPSGSKILQYHKDFNIKNENITAEIQKWWDVYSFPLFDSAFKNKLINAPEEVFAVYFLAIRLHLPWAVNLYDKIISNWEYESISQLHYFLNFLSFFYKRIFKIISHNENIVYAPGYLWDNNYKSINNEIELSKFSNQIYLKLKLENDNLFKINKLCDIQLKNNKKNICISPLTNKSLTEYKIKKFLNIKIDAFEVELPLIWKTGYFEIKNIRFKWILKKKRFQITIHSPKKRKIQINGDNIELFPNKKFIYYEEIQISDSEIHIKLYNRNGGKIFSHIGNQQIPVIVSGFATTKEGTLTNKILYSTNQRKHQLFNINDNFHDLSDIYIWNDINKIKFFSKNISDELEINYIKNGFVNRFMNLSIFDRAKLLLLIDNKFINNTKDILIFFKHNFGFQPDFLIKDNNFNTQMRSNLLIKFEFKQNVSGLDQYEIKENNELVLKGNTFKSLLQNMENLIKNNKK